MYALQVCMVGGAREEAVAGVRGADAEVAGILVRLILRQRQVGGSGRGRRMTRKSGIVMAQASGLLVWIVVAIVPEGD